MNEPAEGATEYLERHSVPFYLQDVVSLLLQSRDDRPLEFIADYFTEVLSGKNVLCRDFEYISQTPANRWAFIVSARSVFAEFDTAQLLSAPELLQLLRLICPDFPEQLVRNATQLCGHEGGPHTLGRLLQMTYARFYYDKYLRWVATRFRECEADQGGRVSIAAVGEALRAAAQLAAASGSLSMPPNRVYDELLVNRGDTRVSLSELQQTLLCCSCVQEALTPSQPQSQSDHVTSRTAGRPSWSSPTPCSPSLGENTTAWVEEITAGQVSEAAAVGGDAPSQAKQRHPKQPPRSTVAHSSRWS